ncbi:tRNA (adenosine(37)-N6)-threonylcarbamoyltransferase complex ATPase subunit type 1 TsaE [Neotabrizicola sp. sgz301269]|uniref:tRNA (adenosine(37)-N6)-threonylcarbamoyltransferase complex ATPase subunit type 1 TsaE n=1 Tax=Neotabrizicola sp. sgz301269 TaxID=3276282 RepID=UPI00376FAFBA
MQAETALILPDESAASAFGARLGKCLRPGMVILLEGPLGAGKTHLARAAIRAICGASTEVPSPSFTLVQTYDGPECEIWHADLYRLTHLSEVDELGLDAAMGREIVLVEWPDRLGAAPQGAVTLRLSPEGEGRRLEISGATAGLLACLGLQ